MRLRSDVCSMQSMEQVWLFEHQHSTCPACRGALDASATDVIDDKADEAARLAFPAEWQVP